MHRYGIDDHRRHFAAWAATTAARASRNCRFTRAQGILIIESNLSDLTAWADLPHANEFDVTHSKLRNAIRKAAADVLDSASENFTHGVAAKLINVYLKCLFLSGPQAWSDASMQEKANALHPPIDRLLLGNLAAKDVDRRADFWRKQQLKGWSNFSSEDYQVTIDAIRHVTSGALWTIEEYWLLPSHSAEGVAQAISGFDN